MAILNYTTKITASKTVGEIQEILTDMGASKIMVDNLNKEPVSVSFQLIISPSEQTVNFRLPCNWEGVWAALGKDGVDKKYRTEEQAKRVAWRIVKDWIEAQMAIIYAGQAQILQVFLPYAIVKETGVTVYDHILNNQKLITN